MADHPNVRLFALNQPVRYGEGWLLAETLGVPAQRWALGDQAALAFNSIWGDGAPLITAEQAILETGEPLPAKTLRRQKVDGGDREIELHHELDGPLQGFGQRLWQHIAGQHEATRRLLDDKEVGVVAVAYRDRYLFTPLSVALLLEVIRGFRATIGQARWASNEVEVSTTNRRSTGDNASRNRVWSDWLDLELRDQVLRAAFDYLGTVARLRVGDTSSTGHGRVLEVAWSSGKRLTLRLDQGVSYWRAATARNRLVSHFDLNSEPADAQGKKLADMTLNIEAGHLSTQLFIKVR